MMNEDDAKNDAAVTVSRWARRLLHYASHVNGSTQEDYSYMTGGMMGGDNMHNNVYNTPPTPSPAPSSTTTTDNAPTGTSYSTGEVDILNAFILLVGGFGIVMGIVFSTYFASVVFDKYCCCCPGFVAVGSLEEFDQGSVTRKAGLWGLRLSERQKILEKVFADKLTVYHARRDVASVVAATDGEADNAVEEAPAPAVLVADKQDKLETDEEAKEETDIEQGDGDDTDDKGDDAADEAKPATVKDKPEETPDDAGNEHVCCICLAEYEEGCTLLTGSYCVHKFHYDCSMAWLVRHDECPYCRMPLVSPKDFREAAIPLLGPGRINDLAYRGAVRIPVVAVVTTTTASLQTDESQQSAAPDEEGGYGGAIAVEANGALQTEEGGDI